MEIPELWSSTDRLAEAALMRAVGDEDLLGALLAIDGAPAHEADAARAWLDDAAARVRQAVAESRARPGHATDRAVAALVQVLVDGEHLVGDASDYYAPDNSRLTRVIARRAGQPILVSSVWILVGARAGLDVVGIGLPGHFVVAVGERIVDPYQGGRVLTPEVCRELAARAMPGRPFDPAWLAPATVGSIAGRVLRNLANAQRQKGDGTSVYRTVRLLATLAPDDGPVQIELGRLAEDLGAWPEALGTYRHIAKAFAGRREAQIAELKVMELESRTRILN
ncbi:MAG: transglutaminase-like domain-containing protein [Myxococcota bacterium]